MDYSITQELASKAPAQPSTTTLKAETELFSEFTLFPKLPIELRLLVWTLAAPAPTTIVQRKSSVKGRSYFFDRPVPAFLQACRESRVVTEYKEVSLAEQDVTLNNHQVLQSARDVQLSDAEM
ncbi:uncharacterized protein PAC_09228 [Phialocephala subalpina]|uniref:2EXR domain-containing protein n=1 Tax=Phialocephala subalpina TaxID=576137 RepID=A0A1L7X2V3_9HELO|nr:uncharacterized protein PAC_09228 [Phialocephala subalpina]